MALAEQQSAPKTWRGAIRQRVVTSPTYARMLRKLSPDVLAIQSVPGEGQARFRNIHLDAEVLVYFADDASKFYQLNQWIPVLEQLDERHRVLLLTRNLGTFRALQATTPLGMVYARRIRDLNHVFQRGEFKVCLYVNNSALNFQPLSWARALHVHLNHGESDKVSMASNQAKAYDYVFVAGQAAVDRYLDNLINYDGSTLVRVGRPQLDLPYTSPLPTTKRTTVLYAPTWEGETDAMNYTSLSGIGVELVRRLVQAEDVRVVYKPHPKVLRGSRPVVTAHGAIVQLISTANAELPKSDQHVVELAAPILSVFPACDVIVSDVSSVVLDWLYLQTSRPIWMTNTRGDMAALTQASPLAEASYVVGHEDVAGVVPGIRASVESDPRRADRERLRRYYFDDLEPGMSTKRFLEAITEKVAERDQLVSSMEKTQTLEVSAGTE